jgi:hypothetical protein
LVMDASVRGMFRNLLVGGGTVLVQCFNGTTPSRLRFTDLAWRLAKNDIP